MSWQISPSYRSLHSCLSNAFPSLPRHSLPLWNWERKTLQFIRIRIPHFSPGALNFMRVSPRFFTSSASFSSQFACELSLWHQHGVRNEKGKTRLTMPQVASTSRKQTDSEHHCESALCLKCKMVRIQENSGYPGCSTHAPPMGTCALASKHDAHSAKSLYVTSLAPSWTLY